MTLIFGDTPNTITSTYHDGHRKLYTTHPTQPLDANSSPEHHMTRLGFCSRTGSRDVFQQGASTFQDAREWAKERRAILADERTVLAPRAIFWLPHAAFGKCVQVTH